MEKHAHSHMGRVVRQTTGYSPAQLNRLIETDEAFWCYRLLGEHFQTPLLQSEVIHDSGPSKRRRERQVCPAEQSLVQNAAKGRFSDKSRVWSSTITT